MSLHLSLENAIAHHQAGEYTAAESIYRALLECEPQSALVWYNLGTLLHQLGRRDEAQQAYEAALQHQPGFADAWHNLGLIARQQQDIGQAIQYFERALQFNPNLAEAHNNLGIIYQQQQKVKKAFSHFHLALQLNPDYGNAHRNLGAFYRQFGPPHQAIPHFKKWCDQAPHQAEPHRALAELLLDTGQTEQAEEQYMQALQVNPQDCDRLARAMLIPLIGQSQSHLRDWREHFRTEVTQLTQSPLDIPDPLNQIKYTPFHLAFQGLNDKELMMALASVYQAFLPAITLPTPVQKKSNRTKIGFISSYFYSHSVMRSFLPLIIAIPKDDFEVFLLAAETLQTDQITAQLQQDIEHFVALPHHLERACQTIAQIGLDILVYTDIGMRVFTHLLAFYRLAPIQCVLAGHPVTTGIPTIDYFISSVLLEPPQAQEHYSEKLIQLRGLPVCYQPSATLQFSRSALGLPEQKHLYICPMTPFKLHPDFDFILADILRGDEQGHVLLFRFGQTQHHTLLAQRFQQQIPDVAERISFLPWVDLDRFVAILNRADVLLDTFPFGAGNTAALALATGSPLITLPGDYMRGRSTQAFYNRMNMLDCLAQSPEHYVALALKIGKDRDIRNALCNQILQRNSLIYNCMDGILELIELWSKMA